MVDGFQYMSIKAHSIVRSAAAQVEGAHRKVALALRAHLDGT